MKGEPLRRTAPYFVHPRFTRNGPLRQTVAAARSVEDNRRKHDDDQDNCFRSAGSRLARASGVGSQRRCMRGRSTPGGMRRSAWRSRRSSWLRLSWRGCCAACLWRTLLLARRRSRLPLTGYLEQAPANELCDLICRRPRAAAERRRDVAAVGDRYVGIDLDDGLDLAAGGARETLRELRFHSLGSASLTPALQFHRAIHPFSFTFLRATRRRNAQRPTGGKTVSTAAAVFAGSAKTHAGRAGPKADQARILDRRLPVLDRLAIDGVADHGDEGGDARIFGNE